MPFRAYKTKRNSEIMKRRELIVSIKAEILRELAQAVVDMDENRAGLLAQEAIDAGLDVYEAITEGLVKGMGIVNEKYEDEEYFVPEVLLCAEAFEAGLKVLRPHLKTEPAGSLNASTQRLISYVDRG